jgi:hypothetical protein
MWDGRGPDAPPEQPPDFMEPIFVPILDGPPRSALLERRPLAADAFAEMHEQLLGVARQLYYGQYCVRGRALLWNEVRARRAVWMQLGMTDADHTYAQEHTLFGEAGTLVGGGLALREVDALAAEATAAETAPAAATATGGGSTGKGSATGGGGAAEAAAAEMFVSVPVTLAVPGPVDTVAEEGAGAAGAGGGGEAMPGGDDDELLRTAYHTECVRSAYHTPGPDDA